MSPCPMSSLYAMLLSICYFIIKMFPRVLSIFASLVPVLSVSLWLFCPEHLFAHTRLFIKAVLTHYSSKASIFAFVNKSLNENRNDPHGLLCCHFCHLSNHNVHLLHQDQG